MRKLYHLWLCPFSRKVRISLDEKKLPYDMQLELPWKKREEFLEINPAGLVPVLIDDPYMVISDSNAICEFLDDLYEPGSLYGKDPYERAEVRRLIAWFDGKFHQEVTTKIVLEKTIKRHLGLGWPDSKVIREGIKNLDIHLKYMNWLLSQRNWLSGNSFSMADITAGAHVSCIDYMGSMHWDKFDEVRDWYIKLKSRPSFRGILQEKVPGISPPDHYSDLDF